MLLTVVDTEFNQPSFSIIQIGAVSLDVKSGRILDEFDVIVNPGEALAPDIITLCGITQEQVDAGIPIAEALERFWAWTSSRSIGAWGDDHGMLFRQSKELAVASCPEYIKPFNIFEVANLLRCAFPTSKSGGLKRTMELFGLPFVGRQHNARDDAYNTAMLVYRMVNMIRGFDQIKGITESVAP